ncbi:MAG: GSCFA domain-containing protein [Dysgonomonas sp.]
MDFRTKIDIPKSGLDISHRSRILMFGSCFIENIGRLLIDNKFKANLNPFGVLYNPLSISQALQSLVNEQTFTGDDIFEYKGLYHSFSHHSSFSHSDKEKCLEQINRRFKQASDELRQSDVLFITFGTAYVFRNRKSGKIVGNCHKLPANNFDRYRLSVEDIVEDWNTLLQKLKEINPSLQVVFTVSPIRHLKDGAHDNQLSKSILLLAIDELCKSNQSLYYFPSYEIVLDDLRDYRFYNEDMVHPNSVAVRYIWERLIETYMHNETCLIIDEWRKIFSALNHRPLNVDSEEYKLFLRQTLLKLKAFDEKYPYICCEEEISDIENRI